MPWWHPISVADIKTRRLIRRAAFCLMALLFAVPVGPASARARMPITTLPVTFQVVNRNDSKAPCPADNKPYQVVGTITGPRASLNGRNRAITTYMHGLSYGKWLFTFAAVPGYDFQKELARLGHISLSYDLIGYGESGKPANGLLSCFGSDAAVAHQIIQQLRSGAYGGKRSPAFRRVALAGHQGAGASAQAEAYSFHDVDALAIIGFADRGVTTGAALAFGQTGTDCATGGSPAAEQAGTSGYAYYADFGEQLHDAKPSVVRAARDLRSLDPCGRAVSAALSLAADVANTTSIDVPVLLAYGKEDSLFNDGPIGTTAGQRDLFGGSPDVTLMKWDDTGTAFTLGRSAPAVRRKLSGWLNEHGF